MANKPSKLGSITDRPKKSRRQREEAEVEETYEDETILDVYERPKSAKELFLQICVIVLVVAFLMTSGMVCAVAPTPQGQDPAQAAVKVDEIAQQIEKYSTDLQKNPNDVATLANLGYYLGQKAANMQPGADDTARMTELATAEGYLRKALEQDPNYAFAQTELGKNLLMQNNYEEAGKFLESALEDAEKSVNSEDEKTKNEAVNRKAELTRLLAYSDVQQGKPEDALAKLDTVLELKPGDANLYVMRSQIHRQMGNLDAARKDIAIVIDIGQKTGNQQTAALGQALMEDINRPAVTPSPAATGSAAPAANATPTADATPVVADSTPQPTPSP